MAEFQTVVKEWDRMCKSHGSTCTGCPINWKNNGRMSCVEFIKTYPDEAERIVMAWSKEHPVMTNRKKFEELFGFTFSKKFSDMGDFADWLDREYKGGDNHD